MINIAFWVLAATVAAGIGLSCCYLAERPILGATRWVSWAHGLAGTSGVCLLIVHVWSSTPDPAGFDRVAAWMLGLTLAGGALVVVAQMRRRKPSGLLVALHAIVGVGGFVILTASVAL